MGQPWFFKIRNMNQRLFQHCFQGLLLVGLVLLYISRCTDIDVQLSDWMYDPARGEFPWKESWFSTVFMHEWVKYILIGSGAVVLALLAIDIGFSLGWLDPDARRKLAVVALSYLAVPLVITLMKSQSIHHCPWDLQRYGGFAPYLRLFDPLLAGVKPGHCFPGGHASSGLWLAAFGVFWLPKRPGMAGIVFAVGLIPGLLLGWVQQMRGAHFLTHTLWSAWIASLIILVIARILSAER
jgi:membrane-associated PAP2 superfamily phosphatase